MGVSNMWFSFVNRRKRYLVRNCLYLVVLCQLRIRDSYAKIMARVPRRVVLVTHRLYTTRKEPQK